jgi:hypothetical protein
LGGEGARELARILGERRSPKAGVLSPDLFTARFSSFGGGGARRLAEGVESVGRELKCCGTPTVSGGMEVGRGGGAATRVVVA